MVKAIHNFLDGVKASWDKHILSKSKTPKPNNNLNKKRSKKNARRDKRNSRGVSI